MQVLDSTATDRESTEFATASLEDSTWLLLLVGLLLPGCRFGKFIKDQWGALEAAKLEENAISSDSMIRYYISMD